MPSKQIIPLVKTYKTPNFCVWTQKPRTTWLWKPDPPLEEVQMQLHWCGGDGVEEIPACCCIWQCTSTCWNNSPLHHSALMLNPSLSSGKKSKILSFLTQRFRGKAKIPHSLHIVAWCSRGADTSGRLQEPVSLVRSTERGKHCHKTEELWYCRCLSVHRMLFYL